MKGLSLTLEVIVIAIVLVVTILVVITVFNKQIAQFLATINPWSEEKAMYSLCQDKCSTYCTAHLGESGTEWTAMDITYRGETKNCDDVMKKVLGDEKGTCKC